jgi:hypothetical protein
MRDIPEDLDVYFKMVEHGDEQWALFFIDERLNGVKVVINQISFTKVNEEDETEQPLLNINYDVVEGKEKIDKYNQILLEDCVGKECRLKISSYNNF